MENDGSLPWGYGMNSFSRLLTDVQYGQEIYMSNASSGSHMASLPGTSYGSYSATSTHLTQAFPSSSQGTNNDATVLTDDIHIDAFGIDHEDDMYQSEEDGEANEDEVEDASTRLEKEAAAITPSWNIVDELDPRLRTSWGFESGLNPFPIGGEFARGQQFNSLTELKRHVITYSVNRGKEYKVVKARDRWYTIECVGKDKGCNWRLTAHKIGEEIDIWTVSRYNGPHAPTCARDMMHVDNRNVTAEFISHEIIPLIHADKSLKPAVIQEIITSKFKVVVSYKRAWDAKQRAIASIFGDWEESYLELPRFMAALEHNNPGTVVEWSTLPSADRTEQMFQRVFWAFGPSIAGFKHCRPILTIDGTHMYGRYKGTLLTAIGFDADNHIFPLAFAVVESENGSSWPWFMELIGSRVTDRIGLCVISDRHKGILKAMRDLPRWREPNAYHRLCVRHLASNFHSKFKDKPMKNLLQWTAYSHGEQNYLSGIEGIGRKDPEARNWLEEAGKEKWSVYHDGGRRYGVMTSNLAECFNGVMKGARSLPITGLVQSSFYKLNAYFVKHYGIAAERSAQGYQFTETTEDVLKENFEKGNTAQVTTFNVQGHVYEVLVPPIEQYARRQTFVVNLNQRTCTCMAWRNLKIACPHVLAVCRHRGFQYAEFVDWFYTTEAHLRTYKMPFQPVGDKLDWPSDVGPPLRPDPSKRRDPGRPGRPRSTRFRNEMDIQTPERNYCSMCKQPGHNKKTCARRASSSRQ